MSKGVGTKLRLSYSLMSAWLKGNPQEAVEIYFRVPRNLGEHVEDGKNIHEDIRAHVEKFNSFPEWLFKGSLTLPKCEMPITVEYNELFDLKGVFDCYDIPTLYEFKTGNQSALDWARTFQVPFYFLIAELSKTEVDRAYLIHYNQHFEEREYVMIWNTQKQRDKAREIIDSHAPEIYEYFTKEGLI